MSKPLLLLALLAATTAFAQAAASERLEIHDDFGGAVSIPTDRPLRVISLAPALTEIIAYYDHRHSQLIGVSSYCNYPEWVTRLPRMGGILDPDYEKLLGAKPDLVYAMEMMPAAVRDKLRALGLPLVFFREPKTLGEIADLIPRIGGPLMAHGLALERAGCKGECSATVDLTGAYLFRGLVPARKTERVMKCLLLSPGQPLWIAGRDTYLDDLLKTAGCRNVASGYSGWTAIELEKLAELKPDWIFFIGKPAPAGSPLERLIGASKIKTFVLDEDMTSRPGPRLAEILRVVETALGTLPDPIPNLPPQTPDPKPQAPIPHAP